MFERHGAPKGGVAAAGVRADVFLGDDHRRARLAAEFGEHVRRIAAPHDESAAAGQIRLANRAANPRLPENGIHGSKAGDHGAVPPGLTVEPEYNAESEEGTADPGG